MIGLLLIFVGLHGTPKIMVEVDRKFPTAVSCELAVATVTADIQTQLAERFGGRSFRPLAHICTDDGEPA